MKHTCHYRRKRWHLEQILHFEMPTFNIQYMVGAQTQNTHNISLNKNSYTLNIIIYGLLFESWHKLASK